jgi:hypothetical protein
MTNSTYQQAWQLHGDFKIVADKDPEGKVPNSIIRTINNLLGSAREEEPESEMLKKLSMLDPVGTKNIEALVLIGQILKAIEVSKKGKIKPSPGPLAGNW